MRDIYDKTHIQSVIQKNRNVLQELYFNENYINETSELISKWHMLVREINDPNLARNTAILLENQYLYNEKISEDTSNVEMLIFKRVSLPIIRRFVNNFIASELVSIQAVKANHDYTHMVLPSLLSSSGRMSTYMTELHARPLQSEYTMPDENGTYKGVLHQYRLDVECEAVADFANALREEFTDEVIRDLSLNAIDKGSYEGDENLLSLIEGLSSYIAIKNDGKEATWIMTNPRIIELLSKHIEKTELQTDLKYNKIGKLADKWNLFENKAGKNEILMGYNGGQYSSGYIFSPYLLMDKQQDGIIASYGKKLINQHLYATIKINLPEEE